MKKLYRVALIFTACFLSGCSLLSPVPAQTQNTYLVKTVPTVPTQKTRRQITLLVQTPGANAVYNTPLMAYSIRPYQIDYYAKNTWLERPGNMLQPLIIQTLQNTHYFHAVISPSVGGNYQYNLVTQVETFLQDYTHGNPVFRLIVRADIIRSSSNQVIATKQFVITQPVLQATPYGGVIAANQATANLLRQLTQFCLKTI